MTPELQRLSRSPRKLSLLRTLRDLNDRNMAPLMNALIRADDGNVAAFTFMRSQRRRLLNTLIERGYASKVPANAGHNGYLMYITSAGRSALETIDAAHTPPE